MLTFNLETPLEVRLGVAVRFKARRLDLNLTQRELSLRSGVTWSSLKRFEREGLIALDSLLNLALVLDCLSDFNKLAAEVRQPASQSLDALLAVPPKRRRASGGQRNFHGVQTK